MTRPHLPPADTRWQCDAGCDVGVLVDQTYGNTDPPLGAVCVQRCDTCQLYPGDIEAAVALAARWGTEAGAPHLGVDFGGGPQIPEGEDMWVRLPADAKPPRSVGDTHPLDRLCRRAIELLGTDAIKWTVTDGGAAGDFGRGSLQILEPDTDTDAGGAERLVVVAYDRLGSEVTRKVYRRTAERYDALGEYPDGYAGWDLRAAVRQFDTRRAAAVIDSIIADLDAALPDELEASGFQLARALERIERTRRLIALTGSVALLAALLTVALVVVL